MDDDRYSNSARHEMTFQPKKPEPANWGSLPAEIRLMILDIFTRPKSPGWTTCAAVCKEWQHYTEKKNFRRLRLRDSCLDEFKNMVIRQRDLVHHIQFIAELPEYSCFSCRKFVSRELPGQSAIGDRIWKLFSILGTWKPATNGITLELNVYSPSDSEHWFKNYYFTSDDSDDEGTDSATLAHDGDVGKISSKRHDPNHGWVNGRRVRRPSKSAANQLFQSVVDTGRQVQFPQVDVVTCFMICRRIRRILRPLDVQYILGSFPRLERMVYEPWQQWTKYCSIPDYWQFLNLLENGFPKTLRRLSLFEDFSDDIADTIADRHGPVYQAVDKAHTVLYRDRTSFVSRIFDLNLEELAISYMVDAADFFPASIPIRTWKPFPAEPWERLQSLALSSQLLQPTISDLETNALLSRAGVSALQMPKLHTFAIWNGTRGMAAAFIYRVYRNHATITWRGTWNHEFTPQVIEAWQTMSSTLHSAELQIEKQIIQDVIESHGDAIHFLDLPCRVVEPASLWQIRRENSLPMA